MASWQLPTPNEIGTDLIVLTCLLDRRATELTKEDSYASVVRSQFGRIGAAILQLSILVNNLGLLVVYLIVVGDVLLGNSSVVPSVRCSFTICAIHKFCHYETHVKHASYSRKPSPTITLIYLQVATGACCETYFTCTSLMPGTTARLLWCATPPCLTTLQGGSYWPDMLLQRSLLLCRLVQ